MSALRCIIFYTKYLLMYTFFSINKKSTNTWFYFCNLYFNYPIMEQILARAIRLTSHKKGKDAILKIFILLGVDNDEYNKHKKELDYIESAFNKGIKTILEVPKELMVEENIDGILTQRKHDFGNSGDLKMLSFVFFKLETFTGSMAFSNSTSRYREPSSASNFFFESCFIILPSLIKAILSHNS